MELTAENVMSVVKKCLVDGGALKAVKVEGIVTVFGFSADMLRENADAITGMLNDLSIEFFPQALGGGDGMTFLNACVTRDGRQWGEHTHMEALFALGIGIGRVESVLPRKLWGILPGGMPYYCVDTSKPVAVPEELEITDDERKKAQAGGG